ncbi:MAG TPA: galactokinase [Nocardioidaceae bacterium]|nr:galactokinase [Nocardioidaceae bacterium]
MSSGRWAAPGRVNLIGEHLDYNGGPVLPIAIDRRTVVEASVRDDARVTVASESFGEPVRFPVSAEPGQVTGWAAYVAGAIWALRSAGHPVPGLDLRVSSDVPVGAGLSSSHALECVVAVAARDLGGFEIEAIDLALLVQRAENDYVGAPTGIMDQLASLCGVAGHALLIDTATLTVRPVPAEWATDDLVLLVVDTHVHHAHADGGYADRRRECVAAASALGVAALADAGLDDVPSLADDALRRRARHVVTETARVGQAVAALGRREWSRLGRLLAQSHASLRDDFEVSCPELDVAVDAAMGAGALGARMTGGGFGGSAIALVPSARVESVVAAWEAAFAGRGFAAPTAFAVEPAAGARRVG